MCGWVDGWMDGWMDGWIDGRAGLRIAYSNQKLMPPNDSGYTELVDSEASPA